MQKNDFLLINEIIYKVYTTIDFDEMRTNFLSLLSVLIPSKESSVFLSNHSDSKHLICDPIIFPSVESSAEQNYLLYENLDYTRWVLMSHKCMIFRESDLISDEERLKSDFFKNLMAPHNLHYSLQLALVYHEIPLGVITLYRTKEMGDFTDEEVFILDSFKDHLNYRFYQHAFTTIHKTNHPEKYQDDLMKDYSLTKRESEIVSLILNGATNQHIADSLTISPHTLKKHIQNIYRKLNVTSKWELFALKKDE